MLLGLEPGALLTELSTAAPIPTVPPDVPVELPAELLRRRPDVRRAERQLAAATVRIGVAVANLFSQLPLTGALGLENVTLADLATGASRFWSIGAVLSWPIFDVGRIRVNIALAMDERGDQTADPPQRKLATEPQIVYTRKFVTEPGEDARQARSDLLESDRFG